jgi:hypothetical protein
MVSTEKSVPKIRRSKIPPQLFNHLLDRMDERKISTDQLNEFAQWLSTNPEVPEGKWFKKFSGMTVCGEDELVKTFLLSSQAADGEELR